MVSFRNRRAVVIALAGAWACAGPGLVGQADASGFKVEPGTQEVDGRFGEAIELEGDLLFVGADWAQNTLEENRNERVSVFRWDGLEWIEQSSITGSGVPDDFQDGFGRDIAVDGGVLVIGAWLDDQLGSAYVYTHDGVGWVEQQRLRPFDGGPADRFGQSVSIDGDTIVVGSYLHAAEGAAYVYTRSGDAWTLQQKLTAGDGETGMWFGYSVALDGDTIVVGAPSVFPPVGTVRHGAVYVFTRDGATWTERTKLEVSQADVFDHFGYAVALHDGVLVATAPQLDLGGVASAGAAFVYEGVGADWSGTATLTEILPGVSSYFGTRVDIDGDLIIVGASQDRDAFGEQSGSAFLFGREGAGWSSLRRFEDPEGESLERFGSAVAIDGDRLAIGAPRSGALDTGAAFIYERVGPVWLGPDRRVVGGDSFGGDEVGYSVALFGDLAVIGAPYDDDQGTNAGAAYVFERTGGLWTQRAKLLADDAEQGDYLGWSVAVYNDSIFVGAPQDDDLGVASGSAYVFRRSGGVWSQFQKVKAVDGGAGDQYGYSVAIAEPYAVIGSRLDDDAGFNAGAAYIVFLQTNPLIWTPTTKLLPSGVTGSAEFGTAVAINRQTVAVGAPYQEGAAGAAYAFTLENGSWVRTRFIAPGGAPADLFGFDVDVSENSLIVGAPFNAGVGAAYVFDGRNGAWVHQATIRPSNGASADEFGAAVALEHDAAIVGARLHNGPAGADQGAAYIYTRNGTLWRERRITEVDTIAGDQFGAAVDMSFDTVLIGAPRDDQRGSNAGAAHLVEGTFGYGASESTLDLATGDAWSSLAEAILNADSEHVLHAAHAAFRLGGDLDFLGLAIEAQSTSEIRQTRDAAWTLADGAAIVAAPERDATLHGAVALPAGAAARLTARRARFTPFATLTAGPGASLTVEGDLDIEISDPSRFDFDEASLIVGAGASFADIEAMSPDSTADLAARVAHPFALGGLTLAPGAVAVIVDAHNNSLDESGPEAVYVGDLTIGAGAALFTGGHVIYYETLTNNGSVDDPANLIQIAACPADLTGDGQVDGADLGLLLGSWGGAQGDLTGDGVTDGADLGLLLGAWGACP
jgi:hypothetical protein